MIFIFVIFLFICKSGYARYFNGALLKSSNMQHDIKLIDKLTSFNCETKSTNFNTCKAENSCGNQTCLSIKHNYNIHCQAQL